MSDTNPKPQRRSYACTGFYFPSDSPPAYAVVYEDADGPMVRTSPFGHGDGLHLTITIDRWRQWNAAVEEAIAAATSLRLAASL